MNGFTDLLKREHKGELILVILMTLYLIMGFKTPDALAGIVDHLVGKVVMVLIVIALFLYSNPVVAVLAALVAFELARRTDTGTLASLSKYAPSEEKKMSQFTAFNQFPYTLEQEMVAKMTPAVYSGASFTQPSFKPMLDNLHDASKL